MYGLLPLESSMLLCLSEENGRKESWQWLDIVLFSAHDENQQPRADCGQSAFIS